jgi:hypothetical protein
MACSECAVRYVQYVQFSHYRGHWLGPWGELEDFHFFHFTTEAIKRTALVQRELLIIDGSMGWEGKCRTPALFVQWF